MKTYFKVRDATVAYESHASLSEVHSVRVELLFACTITAIKAIFL